jgi:hypothetical protein
MAKITPKKTADAVDKKATTSKTTATEAVKADSAAKKKPVANKAALTYKNPFTDYS